MINRRWFVRALAAMAGLLGLGSGTLPASDAALGDALRQATSQLRGWLQSDPSQGAAWERYLELDRLEAALAPGAAGDPAALQRVAARFQSGVPGLELPRFDDVRRLLGPWMAARPLRPLAALSQAARDAKNDFRPASENDLAAARRAVHQQMAALDRRLASAPAAGQGWRSYLLWDALKELGDTRAALDLDQLLVVRNRLRAARLLWRDAAVADVAAAVETCSQVARLHAEPQAAQASAAQLEALAAALDAFLQTGDEAALDAAAAAAGWLAERGLAGSLVHDLRAHLARPNLIVQISQEVLSRQVERPVRESYPVRETISGARVVGRGSIRSQLHLALVPNAAQGEFLLQMSGQTTSATTGTQPRVTTRSCATTDLAGCKRVTLDADGFHAEPADVRASTHIRYTDVAAKLRLFDGIAWRRVEAHKPQAERDSSARTRASIASRLDREAREALDRLNQSFLDDFRRPLVEHGATSEGPHFRTEGDRLSMSSLQATAFQLGPATPPPTDAVPCDVWVRVHDTWIDRVSAGHLSGRTVAGDEFREALARSVRLPKPSRAGPADREDWSITFADDQPLSVDVGDERATIVLRGREFTSEGKTFPEMNITTPYRVQMSPAGVKLVREEPPKLYPPGFVPGSGQRLTGRQLAMRSAMTRVFEQVFEPEYLISEIKPEADDSRLGPLRVVQCDARGGWLNIALRQTTEANP